MKWRNLIKSDVIGAILLFLLVVGSTTQCADAGEWGGGTRAYIGITGQARSDYAPECHASPWVGQFGAEQDIYAHGRSRFVLAYRHNSCLDEEDDHAVMDGFGVRWVWQIR